MKKKINIIKNIGIKITSIIILLVLLLFQEIMPISYAVEEEEIEGKPSADYSYYVEIAGNEKQGYYLKFVDDIDERLEEKIKKNKHLYSSLGVEDVNTIKQYIKAEMATQFPNLSGGPYYGNVVSNPFNEKSVDDIINSFTLEQKVGQMLMVTTTSSTLDLSDVGGYVLNGGFDFNNITSIIDTAKETALQKNMVVPYFATDDEGGKIERAATGYPSAKSYNGNTSAIASDSEKKADELKSKGINLLLAPVADISTSGAIANDERSFGGDANTVSECVKTVVKTMKSKGMPTVLKHFPGYGNAQGNTDFTNGVVNEDTNIDDDISVFKAGISEGASAVMFTNVVIKSIDSSNMAVFSEKVHQKLRDELKFNGIIITDDIGSAQATSSISNKYTQAVKAGNDIIITSDSQYETARNEIVNAVKSGEIKEEDINKSVKRILNNKKNNEILNTESDTIVIGKTEVDGNNTVSVSDGEFEWPVSTQTDPATRAINITSALGTRESPGGIGSTDHAGMDIQCATGTPIVATADGVVEISGEYGGYGYAVKINHGTVDGKEMTSLYGHNSDLCVSVGDSVTKGQVIAYAGSTGNSTGPHCHFEVRMDGEIFNPLGLFTSSQVSGPTQADNINYAAVEGWGPPSGIVSSSSKNKQYVYDENQFQGAVTLRRITPNKQVGEYNDTLVKDEKVENEEKSLEGRGTKEEIPISVRIKLKMESLRGNSTVKMEDLSYLKIPYLNFNGEIAIGTMIVNKSLADEVLDIFQDLYNIKYPIQNMQIIDEYAKDAKKTEYKEALEKAIEDDSAIEKYLKAKEEKEKKEREEEAKAALREDEQVEEETQESNQEDNLLKSSQLDNNTYSFYYKEGGTHATGNAIDLNPYINPKVEGGYAASETASAYLERDPEKYNEGNSKEALITKESEVYKIFEKYGWTWGGNSENPNYMHFEKKTISDSSTNNDATIDTKVYDLSYVPKDVFDQMVSSNNRKALEVFTLDDNFQAITATWSYSTDGGLKISKGKSLNYRKALNKYTMPFELLVAILVDVNSDVEFTEELAQLAIDSEYVIAVEDKVSTTRTTVNTTYITNYYYKGSGGDLTQKEGSVTTEEPKVTINENVSQKTEITYVDCWYVKFTKDISYSKNSVKEGRVNAKGKVKKSSSTTTENYTEEGDSTWEVYYITEVTKTTTVDNVTYEFTTGNEHIGGNAKKFSEIYNKKKHAATRRNLAVSWLSDILEEYSATVNYIDIMKYLVYQAENRKFYSISTIKFEDYKPDDFSSTTGNNASGSLSITGNTVKDKIWNALKSAGYSDIAVAAAMGNLQHESGGFNPSAIEDGSGEGFGLVQWSFGRRDQIEAFAEHRGKDPTDVDLQIEFLIGELTPSGGADGFAEFQFNKENLWNTWMESTDIGDATMAFCDGFERPRYDARFPETRIGFATECYEQYHK